MKSGIFETRVLARGNKARIFMLTKEGWELIARLHATAEAASVEFYPCEIPLDRLVELAVFARRAAHAQLPK